MSLTSPPEESVPVDEVVQQTRRTVIVAGALAVGVVVSAWFIGAGQGLDQIGQEQPSTALLPKIREPAPDFTMSVVDERGRARDRVHLSDFQGHPVWLNFWGSWCLPCQTEMPQIQAAYAQLEPRGLVWLAVSLDEPAADAAGFAARNNASFVIASDPHRADTDASYPIAYFPTHILIDAQGIVRDIVIAGLDQKEIVKRAERVLADSK